MISKNENIVIRKSEDLKKENNGIRKRARISENENIVIHKRARI